MSCQFVDPGPPREPCKAVAQWLVEGQTAEPFSFGTSDHERYVCDDGMHLVETIKEFAGEGVCPVLVSEFVEGTG